MFKTKSHGPIAARWWGILGLGLALHLLAGWNSVGFHHADEYSQILEFAGYKMGLIEAKNLAWEFGERIRPFFQPALHVGISRLAGAFGVHSVMTQTTLARLFMALLGWSSVVALLWASRFQWREGENSRGFRVAVLTSMLFWFHPWFHARTSSEGLAAAFLLFGVAALLRLRPWVAGLCLGLAFQARYLLAVETLAVAGMLIWGAMGWRTPRDARARLRLGILGVTGFATALVVGAIADRWGYGEWVFPAWRYVWVNGIQARAHQYGVAPWWDYVPLMLVKMPPILGAFALTVVLTFWVAFWGKRKGSRYWVPHWITWMTLPFVLTHMIIAHKESRFMYPIASFLPIMLGLWVERVGPFWQKWVRRRASVEGLRQIAAVVLWTVNFFYLSYGVLANEHNPMRYQMEIADRFPQGLTLYSQSDDDVYGLGRRWWGMPPNYHFVGGVSDTEFAQLVAKATTDAPIWFHSERLIPHPGIREASAAHCSLEYAVVPKWATRINIGGWVERSRIWTLWKCDH